jgi:hypothetical protein
LLHGTIIRNNHERDNSAVVSPVSNPQFR